MANNFPRVLTSGMMIVFYAKVKQSALIMHLCLPCTESLQASVRGQNYSCLGRGLCACGKLLEGLMAQWYLSVLN